MIYKSNEKSGPLAPMGPTCPTNAPNATTGAFAQIREMLSTFEGCLALGQHPSGLFLCTEGVFLIEAYCAPDFVQIDIHVHGEGCTAHYTDGQGKDLARGDLGRQPLSMDGLTLLFVEGTLLLPCEY